MRRLLMDRLVEWKDDFKRKPILITGVRQCGKTHLLKEFARGYFPEDHLYLNLEENPAVAEVFQIDLVADRIIRDLKNLYYHKEIVPGKTLIILDEIQVESRAITAMKYFNENMPELHIIGAGSSLGVSLRRDATSYPVGKVTPIQMYPMNFKEFLWATKSDHLVEAMDDTDWSESVPSIYHEPLKRQLLDYYLIGGMPEAVKTWVETQNDREVAAIQSAILDGYRNDFSKYAPIDRMIDLETIWEAVPVQLAEDNQKFIFSRVKRSARAKDLEPSIQWLLDAGLIYRLHKIENASETPLVLQSDKTYYKIYLSDIGLMGRMLQVNRQTFQNPQGRTGRYMGILTENYVLTELITMGFDPVYWKSGNTAELDFLIEKNGLVVPVEAKAKINRQAKSYAQFVKKYRPEMGLIFSLEDRYITSSGGTTTYHVPLYFVHRIPSLIK